MSAAHLGDLRPRLLDTLGLNAAIRRHVDDFARLTGVACDVKVAAQVALPQDRATGCSASSRNR